MSAEQVVVPTYGGGATVWTGQTYGQDVYVDPASFGPPVGTGFTLDASLGAGVLWDKITNRVVKAIADPVDAATGSFVHESSDISLPSKGVPFSLVRSYDSRSAYDGPLGKGWGHGFDERLAVGSSGAVTWSSGGGGSLVFTPNGTGGYIAPTGVIASLRAASLSGWELVRSDQVISAFDVNGRLLSKRDRSGQGLVFAYDASARLSTVTDAGGRVHTFTYGTTGAALNRLVQVAKSDLRTVKFAYTAVAAGTRLTSFTDERAKVTTYQYDVSGFLTKQVDPQGNSEFVNVYDTAGRVTQQQDALANVSTFVWNDAAGTVTFTDAAGAMQTHQSSNYAVGASSGPEGSSSIGYDANMNPSSFTDQVGAVWAATYDARGNMLTRTAPAPLSYTESWTYDGMNNPLTYVDGRGNTTTYTYDGNGRLLSEVRPGAVTTSYTYNADGTLASMTDPRGGISLYTYDTAGNVASSTTPLGNKTTYAYDTSGRVVTITSPRGNEAGATATSFQRKFTYDADGNVLTEKDELGRTTTNVYDNAGRRTQTTAPDGGITTYTYNAANEVVSATAPDGGVTTYVYDARGLKTSETSATGAITTYAYDPAGRMITRVEPRGNVAGATATDFTWTYAYDGVGRLTSQTDPLGRVTTMAYDPLGRVTTTTRPDGTTTAVYDPNGNTTSTTVSGIGTSTAVFDALNRVSSSTDVRGKTSTYTYDPAGNQLSVTDPLARVTTMTYDADGRSTSIVDPRGNVSGADPNLFRTSFTYDTDGNRLTTTDPLGNATVTTYDRVGNVASVKNPRNNTTTFTYDNANRVTKVTAPTVGATSYAYSTMGTLLSRTDPLLRTAAWTYDRANRVTKKTDPLGRFFTYGYDIAGNLTSIVDANANAAANPALGTTTLTYDRLNRIGATSFSDATPGVTFTYDTQGRRASMVDGTGTTTYGYDGGNRVTTVTKGGDVFTYMYDPAGNVTSRTYPDGRTVTATYNDAGETATVNDGSGLVTYTYDPAGNLNQMVLPAGVTQNRVYDRASRLMNINNQRAGGVFSQFTYTRDANGNPTAIDIAGTGAPTLDSQRNTYDTYDRLTKTCFTTTTCTTTNQTLWTYDKVGNRLTEKIGSAGVSTYTYDNADQLTGIIGPGAASFTYNPNGDQLTAGTDTYGYNTARQPVTATVGGVTSAFTYDGDNNRSQITTGGVATAETVDVNNPLPVIVTEKKAGVAVRTYSYAPGGTMLRYSDVAAGTSGWYLSEALGSVTEIVNPTGGTVATYRYNPFGSTRATTLVGSGYTNNPLKYTGQQQDPTGNYNLRARHYNPGTGRFGQTDPIDPMSGAQTSAYLYANANPALLIDPSGQAWSWKDTKSFIGGAASSLGQTVAGGARCANNPVECSLGNAKALVSNVQEHGVVQGVNKTINPMIPILNAGVECSTGVNIMNRTRSENKKAAACGNFALNTTIFAATAAAPLLKVKVATPAADAVARTEASLGRTGAAATETGAGAGAAGEAAEAPYGATPKGRPFTKHYGEETGPGRNIPGSAVDEAIDSSTGKAIDGGKTVHYDPKNNLTVVTGDQGKIVSVHKGPPRAGQR